MPKYNKPKDNDADYRELVEYIKDNHTEMSSEEMSLELAVTPQYVQKIGRKHGYNAFSETSRSWKRQGYKRGPNGYAMYPYKGSFRESASVQNDMLVGEIYE